MHFFTFLVALIAAAIGYVAGSSTTPKSKSKRKSFIVIMPGDPEYTVIDTYFTKKELEETNVVVHAEVVDIKLANQFCKLLNSH